MKIHQLARRIADSKFETDYVESLSTKNKCFYNTIEESEAKRYSEKSVSSLMTKLASFNETDDNYFKVITV